LPSPLRLQYLDLKRRHPDAILLFRLGDFYETFDDDAEVAARDLEIVLTHRDMGKGEVVPMAGIPYHALEGYLGRLIRKGHRVAICEQMTEPIKGRVLVERDVVRVVTRGTVVEPSLLEGGANNYLASVALGDDEAGVAHVDVTTGEFTVAQMPMAQLAQELARLAPTEVVVARPPGDQASSVDLPGVAEGSYQMTSMDAVSFSPTRARQRLLDLFSVASLAAYGCEGLPLAVAAAGAIVEYLDGTHQAVLGQLRGLSSYTTDDFMVMDAQTRRNLELFHGGRWGAREHSLLAVLDVTKTPMGARMLRKWLGQPLLDLTELARRQDAVEWLHQSSVRRQRLQASLAAMGDPERIVHRMGAGAASPREVVALRRSLEQVPSLKAQLVRKGEVMASLDAELSPCADAVNVIANAIADDPRGEMGLGGVIREGFSAEMDELRSASQDARSYIAGLELRERERTGIPSLKVGYNRVFGYYLEVSNAHAHRVPEDYVRRQTLVSAERYFTPELKEHESLVLNARERLEELEGALYRQVCRQVADMTPLISRTAAAVAKLDVFVALAEAAVQHRYVRPVLDESDAIEIRAGRHPVVERALPAGSFVPNDVAMDRHDAQLLVITGPNMAGKSTYLRQVALLVLMAQVGSFVPAEQARIGLVDRIFTRVGLQDDLAGGQSTFMVEMVETASILHHATPRSLVVLDEIGRGTSTYDGMSIAQAVVEHLHDAPHLGCRTLFSTHYHELTALTSHLPRVRNHNVAVAEADGDIVFLHRIVPGGADRSYGVHVGQLAGLPRTVVQRAWKLLAELESKANGASSEAPRPRRGRAKQLEGLPQLPLFVADAPLPEALAVLMGLDINSMTPVEALNKLYELQQLAGEDPK
jgi:DNA mismatch repair protein MutS